MLLMTICVENIIIFIIISLLIGCNYSNLGEQHHVCGECYHHNHHHNHQSHDGLWVIGSLHSWPTKENTIILVYGNCHHHHQQQ